MTTPTPIKCRKPPKRSASLIPTLCNSYASAATLRKVNLLGTQRSEEEGVDPAASALPYL